MDDSMFPPGYDEAPVSGSSSSQAPFPIDSKHPVPNRSSQAPSTRYLYYQIFAEGMASPAKNPAPDSTDPNNSIARIRARDIAPPRTVGIIKRAIATAESIPVTRISGLFLLASSNAEATDDNFIMDILDERGRGPGGNVDVPLGVVLSDDKEEVGCVVMSRTEPGKAATDARPGGWKSGKTRGNAVWLGLAMKPRGGLRWMDGTIETGLRVWVDTSSLTNVADWGKTYSMYPVVLIDTRLYGFIPADSIELDPEPTPGKGKFDPMKYMSSFIRS